MCMRVALRSWRWVIRSMIDAAKFACLINFDLFDYQRFSATTMLGFWLLLVGTRQYQLSPVANHNLPYDLATTLASYSVLIQLLIYLYPGNKSYYSEYCSVQPFWHD